MLGRVKMEKEFVWEGRDGVRVCLGGREGVKVCLGE